MDADMDEFGVILAVTPDIDPPTPISRSSSHPHSSSFLRLPPSSSYPSTNSPLVVPSSPPPIQLMTLLPFRRRSPQKSGFARRDTRPRPHSPLESANSCIKTTTLFPVRPVKCWDMHSQVQVTLMLRIMRLLRP